MRREEGGKMRASKIGEKGNQIGLDVTPEHQRPAPKKLPLTYPPRRLRRGVVPDPGLGLRERVRDRGGGRGHRR